MKGIVAFYGSTVGKKVVVALTGAALLLFVVGHMVGNLKTFMGMDVSGLHHLDIYAHFLREFGAEALGHGGFLWLARIGLLGCLVLHVGTILQLRARNHAARPVGYQHQDLRASTSAARSMWVGGFIILGFVLFHLGHLTTGTFHPAFVEGEVYRNLYHAFQNPAATAFYVIAMIALGFHLYHGTWSLFQTLGLDNPDRNSALRQGAQGLALIVVFGFIAVPLAVYFGLLPAPQ